jgi:hypothetical protein
MGDACCSTTSVDATLAMAAKPDAVQPRMCGLAIASLVCGITSIVFLLGFMSGIPAALLGHLALERIRESGGTHNGRRLAQAGLVLGYGATVASILLWVTWLLAAA